MSRPGGLYRSIICLPLYFIDPSILCNLKFIIGSRPY